jgi:type IV secretory pathway TrbL component
LITTGSPGTHTVVPAQHGQADACSAHVHAHEAAEEGAVAAGGGQEGWVEGEEEDEEPVVRGAAAQQEAQRQGSEG